MVPSIFVTYLRWGGGNKILARCKRVLGVGVVVRES